MQVDLNTFYATWSSWLVC